MDKAKRKHSEFRAVWWRFLGLWVLGAVVGWSVSYYSSWPIYSGGGSGWFILTLTIIPGFFIGLLQAISIRHTLINPFNWFYVTIAAHLLTIFLYYASVVSILISDNINPILGQILYFILTFGSTAIFQWLFVLRRQIRWSWLWPIFVTVIYGLTWNIIPSIIEYDVPTLFNWSPLWIGIVSNIINGTFMLFLMNHTQREHMQLATSSPPIERT